MGTRTHEHEELFDTTPERLFALLHTPSAIRKWWGATRVIVVPEPEGLWTACWGEDEDEPDYVTWARLEAFDPPRRMVLSDYEYRADAGRGRVLRRVRDRVAGHVRGDSRVSRSGGRCGSMSVRGSNRIRVAGRGRTVPAPVPAGPASTADA